MKSDQVTLSMCRQIGSPSPSPPCSPIHSPNGEYSVGGVAAAVSISGDINGSVGMELDSSPVTLGQLPNYSPWRPAPATTTPGSPAGSHVSPAGCLPSWAQPSPDSYGSGSIGAGLPLGLSPGFSPGFGPGFSPGSSPEARARPASSPAVRLSHLPAVAIPDGHSQPSPWEAHHLQGGCGGGSGGGQQPWQQQQQSQKQQVQSWQQQQQRRDSFSQPAQPLSTTMLPGSAYYADALMTNPADANCQAVQLPPPDST